MNTMTFGANKLLDLLGKSVHLDTEDFKFESHMRLDINFFIIVVKKKTRIFFFFFTKINK